MTRINPKLFEPFVDPDKGEWIRIVRGTYEGVIWRPVDMEVGEENEDGSANLNFKVELLEAPEIPKVDPLDVQFEKVCGKIIMDIVEETVEQHKNGN